MDKKTYSTKVQEILSQPLDPDNPKELFNQIALIESMAFLAVKYSTECEQEIIHHESALRCKKGQLLPSLKGTQLEKQTELDCSCNDILVKLATKETEMKYWKNIGKLIENKVSLAQSILSNIGSQIKAGIFMEAVK